jgi:hypothetical protein
MLYFRDQGNIKQMETQSCILIHCNAQYKLLVTAHDVSISRLYKLAILETLDFEIIWSLAFPS